MAAPRLAEEPVMRATFEDMMGCRIEYSISVATRSAAVNSYIHLFKCSPEAHGSGPYGSCGTRLFCPSTITKPEVPHCSG